MARKKTVLFLCTGNSARSQMAEALLRHHYGDQFDAYSAGTEPKRMNPLTVEAMSDIGVSTAGQWSKGIKEYLGKLHVHYLVIVCSDADQSCPRIWPGVLERLYWPFDDPASARGTRDEKLPKFREIRDQIERKIHDWVAELRGAGALDEQVA